jgi:hypothetical protein
MTAFHGLMCPISDDPKSHAPDIGLEPSYPLRLKTRSSRFGAGPEGIWAESRGSLF